MRRKHFARRLSGNIDAMVLERIRLVRNVTVCFEQQEGRSENTSVTVLVALDNSDGVERSANGAQFFQLLGIVAQHRAGL